MTRYVLLLCMAMPAVAQVGPLSVPEKAPAQSEKEQLYHLLDDLRAAIRHDDWAEAWRLRIQLDTALDLKRRSTGQISPELELAHVELMAGRDATTRTPLLPRLAKTAYAARRYDKAEIYANEALAASKQGVFWWTGDAIHQGNIVLGRIALLRADVPTAIGYLLAAGKTPGSSTLNTTGPNMGLARDLLNSGQTDPVVQYLEECRAFWKADRGKLLEWLALVRAGLKPDFGPNLDY